MAAFDATVLATAATGNFTSAVAIRNSTYDIQNPGAVVITSAIGATPTVTVNIQGSADGVNFFNIPYALVATPSTFVVTAITITTAVTTTYLLQANQPWQFLQFVASANTNVTLTSSAYI
jgi:hypothetical protein